MGQLDGIYSETAKLYKASTHPEQTYHQVPASLSPLFKVVALVQQGIRMVSYKSARWVMLVAALLSFVGILLGLVTVWCAIGGEGFNSQNV